MSRETTTPTDLGWQSIVAPVFHNAARRGDHPAIVDGEGTLTYSELALLVERTAGHLLQIGIRRGDIVGTCLPDTSDYVVAMLALAHMGAAILPMDVRWTDAEKSALAEGFAAVAVLVGPDASQVGSIATFRVDDEWRAARTHASFDPALAVDDRTQPLVLSLSSGTTGRPKGPMISHGNVLNRLLIYTASLGFRETDRFMLATPLYFGGGRYMTLCYLIMGATVVLSPPPYSTEDLIERARLLDITSLFVVPTLLRRILDSDMAFGELLFPNMRALVSSGSILHAEERDAIRSLLTPNFYNFYASTEGGGVCVLAPDDPHDVSGSIGKPVFGTELQIVDEADNPLAAGEVGAIRYRGGTVAPGFYNDPEASAEAFKDGWYYPGDLGRRDERGYFYLVGRTKDVIIRGGVNVYPFDVEQHLLTIPGIAEAAVVAWPSPQLGEELAAFVAASRGQEIDPENVLSSCRASLSPYKVPRQVFVVDDMPKSSMGKILKADLAKLLPPMPQVPTKR
ncbi:MAG: AMP-binding protein [Mesorhizobium sp.]|nr:AMP-binding protein [Mesorhizobium sp.]